MDNQRIFLKVILSYGALAVLIVETGQRGFEQGFRGNPRISMDIHGISMVHGYPWISMELHGYP